MVKKQAQYRIQGMNRDITESVSNADKSDNLFKYAYEIKNMRVLVNTEDNNTFSLVNEKGTAPIEISNNTGNIFSDIMANCTVLGVKVLNDYIVLFLTGNTGSTLLYKDYILRFEYLNTGYLEGRILYNGNLGFDKEYPIEAITCYENDSIQKIYWTDGLNSPRMINIIETYSYQNSPDIDSQFDFVPTMALNEQVTITKLNDDYGQFQAGTIQYVLTYSNRYAQETNPFYISPLFYNIKNSSNSSELDRGGKVDEICTKPYRIRIKYIDNTFDLINIYSINTTEQNTRYIKKICTINNQYDSGYNYIDYIDTGKNGETVDINDVTFINEKWSLIVQTLNHKDNRLFAGNIETTNPRVSTAIKNALKGLSVNYMWEDNAHSHTRMINLPVTSSDYYPYQTQLDMNSFQMKTFKSDETYRFGVQFQDKTGKWSEAIFIKDEKNTLYPHYIFYDGNRRVEYYYTFAKSIIPESVIENALDDGFVKIRPVVVFPSWNERRVVCQGLLCPTVYSTAGRNEALPYAQSSWFTRPNPYKNIIPPERNIVDNISGHSGDDDYCQMTINEYANMDTGFIAEFRHNVPIPANHCRNGEFYCNDANNTLVTPYGEDNGYFQRDKTGSNFYIDQSLVTMHSPEFEFDANLQSYDLSTLKFRVIGVINWTSNKTDIEIQAGSSPNNFINVDGYTKPTGSTVTTGFIKPINPIGASGINPNGYKTLIGGPFWNDYFYTPNTPQRPFDSTVNIMSHVVFPFHKDELNNYDSDSPAKDGSNAEYKRVPLNSKILYNARYSIGNNYFDDVFNYTNSVFNTGNIKIWQGTELLLDPPENSDITNSITYYGGRNVTINAPTKKEYTGNIDGVDYTLPLIQHITGGTFEYANSVNRDLYYERSAGYSDYYWSGSGDFVTAEHRDNKNLWSIALGGIQDKFGTNYPKPWGYFRSLCYSANAWVRMQYSSTNHAVIVLNNYKFYNSSAQRDYQVQVTLPTIDSLNCVSSDLDENLQHTGWCWGSGNNFYGHTEGQYHYNWSKPFWADHIANGSDAGIMFLQPNKYNWSCELIDGYTGNTPSYNSGIKCGWSLLGELYRDIDDSTRFGGTSESAMESNIWYVAGEEVKLENVIPEYGLEIYWDEGDTYFQRYDHLKTYSPANVQNGIVDVASFMVETRINLDGRCDINRGRNYFGANNTNFNLMNMAYTQDNNMFSSHTTDNNWLDLDKYPNQVIWSPVKNYGERIDSWCNLSPVTALDFDGDKGVIRKIERFANELIVFQDNAISKINYNQNVQIATSTGTPIQIANSNAIEGKVYLTTSIGTRNKWSIVNTPTGIYFIDYSNIGIYKFNGHGIPVNLSDTFGFRSFMIRDLRTNLSWNPYDFGETGTQQNPNPYGEFVGYYDDVNGDVFYINRNDCLAFNDKINSFTSFYSYENTPYFFNYRNMGFFIKNGHIWKEHGGNYSNFFYINKDYWVTLITNPSSHTDKIFDNVEYRSDMFDYTGTYIPDKTFRDIRVWNEYQDSGTVNLSLRGSYYSSGISYGASKNIPSNIKKKFRTWRIQIPRNNGTRDRIRNPWTYIKLTGGYKTGESLILNKHVLHDIIVDYFE